MQVFRRMLGLRSAEEVEDDIKTAPLKASHIAGVPNQSLPSPADGATAPLSTAPFSREGGTRQLEPFDVEFTSSGQGTRFIIGQKTDVGQVRDNNQDAISTFTSIITSVEERSDFGLFIVADGMGGHEDGEKASGFAARIVAKNVLNDLYLPMLADSYGGSSDQQPVTEVLKQSVQKANDHISAHVPDGGTTVTSVTVVGNMAYIAHVGDSRAYLINQDGIEQLTRDHSLVQRLIELGQLTPEEAIEHPQRNVLYRAIGQGDVLDVDALTRQLTPGSYLLICSDGLWNLVSNEELLSMVLNHGSNTQLACQSLIDLANERGGTDNISVILVRIPEG